MEEYYKKLHGLTRQDWEEWENQAQALSNWGDLTDERKENMFRNWAFKTKISNNPEDVNEFKSFPKEIRDSVFNARMDAKNISKVSSPNSSMLGDDSEDSIKFTEPDTLMQQDALSSADTVRNPEVVELAETVAEREDKKLNRPELSDHELNQIKDILRNTSPTFYKYENSNRMNLTKKWLTDAYYEYFDAVENGANDSDLYVLCEKLANQNIYDKDEFWGTAGRGIRNNVISDLPGFIGEAIGWLGGFASGLVYPALGIDPYTMKSLEKEYKENPELADIVSHGFFSSGATSKNPFDGIPGALRYAVQTGNENPISQFSSDLIGSNSWNKEDQKFYKQTGVASHMVTRDPEGSILNKNTIGTFLEQAAGTESAMITGMLGGYLFEGLNVINGTQGLSQAAKTIKRASKDFKLAKAKFSGGFSGTAEGLSNSIETYNNTLNTESNIIENNLIEKYKDAYKAAYEEKYLELAQEAQERGEEINPREIEEVASQYAEEVYNKVSESDRQADLNEARRSATKGAVQDLVVNSVINGFVNTYMTTSIFGDRMSQALENLQRNTPVKVGIKDGTVKQLNKLATGAAAAWKLNKGWLGESGEEYFQNISSDVASAVSMSYFDNYLQNKYNPEGSDTFGKLTNMDALGDAVEAGAKAFRYSLTSRESIESAIYGGLGYLFGSLKAPGMNHNLSPWQMPVLRDISNAVKYQGDINTYVNNLNDYYQKNKNVSAVSQLINWGNQRFQSERGGSTLNFRVSAEGEDVAQTMLLEGLRGTDFYDNEIVTLQKLASITTASDEEKQEAIETYKENHTTPLKDGQPAELNEEQVLQEIESKAKAKLDQIEEIGSYMKEIDSSTELHNLPREVKDGLVFSKYLLKRQEEEYDSLQSEHKKLSIENSPMPEGMTSVPEEYKSTYVTGRRSSLPIVEDRLKKAKENIADLKKAVENPTEYNKDKKKHYSRFHYKRALKSWEKEKARLEKLVDKQKESEVVPLANMLLTESEIMALPARERAIILDKNNRRFYSAEQLAIIDNLLSQAIQQRPDFAKEVQTLADLKRSIDVNKSEYYDIVEDASSDSESAFNDYVRSVQEAKDVEAAKSNYNYLNEITSFTGFEKAYSDVIKDKSKKEVRLINQVARPALERHAAQRTHLRNQAGHLQALIKGSKTYRDGDEDTKKALLDIINLAINDTVEMVDGDTASLSEVKNLENAVIELFTDDESGVITAEKVNDRLGEIVADPQSALKLVLDAINEASGILNETKEKAKEPKVDTKVPATEAPVVEKAEVKPSETEDSKALIDLIAESKLSDKVKAALTELLSSNILELVPSLKDTIFNNLAGNETELITEVMSELNKANIDAEVKNNLKNKLHEAIRVNKKKVDKNNSTLSEDKAEKKKSPNAPVFDLQSEESAGVLTSIKNYLKGKRVSQFLINHKFNKRDHVLYMVDTALNAEVENELGDNYKHNPVLAVIRVTDRKEIEEFKDQLIEREIATDQTDSKTGKAITNKAYFMPIGVLPLSTEGVESNEVIRIINTASSPENIDSNGFVTQDGDYIFSTTSTKVVTFTQGNATRNSEGSLQHIPMLQAIFNDSNENKESSPTGEQLSHSSSFMKFIKGIVVNLGITLNKKANKEEIAYAIINPGSGDPITYSVYRTEVLKTIGRKSGNTFEYYLTDGSDEFEEMVRSGEFGLNNLFLQLKALINNESAKNIKALIRDLNKLFDVDNDANILQIKSPDKLVAEPVVDNNIITGISIKLGTKELTTVALNQSGQLEFTTTNLFELLKNLCYTTATVGNTTKEVPFEHKYVGQATSSPVLQWNIKYRALESNFRGKLFDSEREEITNLILDGKLSISHDSLVPKATRIELQTPQRGSLHKFSNVEVPQPVNVGGTVTLTGTVVDPITGLPVEGQPKQKKEIKRDSVFDSLVRYFKELPSREIKVKRNGRIETIRISELFARDEIHPIRVSPTKIEFLSPEVNEAVNAVFDSSVEDSRPSETQKEAAFAIGNSVDEACRVFMRNQGRQRKSAKKIPYLSDVTIKSIEDGIAAVLNTHYGGYQWLNKDLDQIPLHSTIEVTVKEEGKSDRVVKLPLVGYPDLVGYNPEDGTFVIIDLKTYSGNSISPSLMQGYRYQQTAYKQAFAESIAEHMGISVEEALGKIAIKILPIKVEYQTKDGDNIYKFEKTTDGSIKRTLINNRREYIDTDEFGNPIWEDMPDIDNAEVHENTIDVEPISSLGIESTRDHSYIGLVLNSVEGVGVSSSSEEEYYSEEEVSTTPKQKAKEEPKIPEPPKSKPHVFDMSDTALLNVLSNFGVDITDVNAVEEFWDNLDESSREEMRDQAINDQTCGG